MQEFRLKVLSHVEHIKSVGSHCSTEETTKQALILPFLNILEFNPFDPHKVKAEYSANLPGLKASERVDYALFSEGNPAMFIEAKAYSEKLSNHAGQLARYFNSTPGVAVAAITNGREWRFFTDLKLPNVMDEHPFLSVSFDSLSETDIEQLAQFRYGNLHPDRLRSFAEERVYQELFQAAIENCLRDVDQDFVRFVANRANPSAKLTSRFVEAITPMVKRAVADAISKMVVTGLSAPPAHSELPAAPPPLEDSVAAFLVDPVNPKIITTPAERKLLAILKEMLSGVITPEDVVGKDTESYYTVLYQGKSNRWIARYINDRAKPLIYFPIELTEQHKEDINRRGLELGPSGSIALDKPESIMRLSGLIFEVLSFCQNDDNFRKERKKSSET